MDRHAAAKFAEKNGRGPEEHCVKSQILKRGRLLNMATMSRYCKAYVMPRFREFNGWSEKRENVRGETKRVDGKEEEFQRELTDEDYLFLQDNFVVTDGIFKDQNI